MPYWLNVVHNLLPAIASHNTSGKLSHLINIAIVPGNEV